MTKFSRALAMIFLVLIFLLSIAFSFFNTQEIALSFGFFVLTPQPLAVWVLSAFVIGALIGLGLGAGLFRQLRKTREIARLQAELQRTKPEKNSLTSA